MSPDKNAEAEKTPSIGAREMPLERSLQKSENKPIPRSYESSNARKKTHSTRKRPPLWVAIFAFISILLVIFLFLSSRSW